MMDAATESPVLSSAPRAKAIRAIRDIVTGGALAPGEPLPSERTLAKQLQVSRRTLRWALSTLEEEGLIGSRGGKTRVANRLAPAPSVADPLLENAVIVLSNQIIALSSDYHDPAKTGNSDAIIRGALQGVADAGYHTLLLHPGMLNQDMLRRIASGKPKGFVLPWFEEDQAKPVLSYFAQTHAPIIAYGSHPDVLGFDRIESHHESGSYRVTQWLIAQGRKRPLFFWTAPTDLYWYAPRLAGYQRAMREAGLEPMPPVILQGKAFDQSETAEDFDLQRRACAAYLIEKMLGDQAVDAIIVPSDGYVCGVAAACRLCGKAPGQDVLIAGYDNYWDKCWERRHESYRPAATVDKRNFEMGQAMVQMLEDRIHGRLPQEPQCRLIEPVLVVPQAE